MRDPEHLRAFVRRDWAAIARAKDACFRDGPSPTERLRIASALWEHARALHPGWPSEAQRDADRANHLRVSDALRRVPPRRR